ncbi:MAG: hypothetical protein ACI9EF_002414 [Pseudohongiellaceae bacterium]|jgi:hypothetical protein
MSPGKQAAALPLVLALALAAITLLTYWPVREAGFVNYDDDAYVTANAELQHGLSSESIAWAFSSDTTVASNWHPLTMLSHLTDVSLFGLEADGHHLTSLLFHAVNTVLLLLLLHALTGSLWCSAFVAALFALHPLNVQSVAWVSERKNVLSTFFWFSSLWAYARYARSHRLWLLGATAALLALGLMAKSMLVTLPCTLLLLDMWPLNRVGKVGWQRLILEKLPLFAIVALASLVTVNSQAGSDAMLANIPFGYRLANAFSSYLTYLAQIAWPHPLSIFYPHPGSEMTSTQLAFAGVSAVVVVAVTTIVFRQRRKAPWALFGWLWFLGTLVPVIGLVQVGGQAVADRYTYVPALGVFIMVTWGMERLSRPWAQRRLLLSLSAALCLTLFAVRTRAEIQPWMNSEALFRHALQENPDNYLAHTNLGSALYERGLKNEAMSHMAAAVKANSGYALAMANLGTLHAEAGQLKEAERLLLVAAYMAPETARAHTALGAVSIGLGKFQRAEIELRRALDIDPDFAAAHLNVKRLRKVWQPGDKAPTDP